MYKLTCSYDSNAPHWNKEFTDELEAHEAFASFLDWGFADEYATVNLFTPSGKCYTKVFYRSGMVSVK